MSNIDNNFINQNNFNYFVKTVWDIDILIQLIVNKGESVTMDILIVHFIVSTVTLLKSMMSNLQFKYLLSMTFLLF